MTELEKVLNGCLVDGFWGKVTLTIQNGKMVLITKEETVKVK